MCTVSTVLDGWRDPTWPYQYPGTLTLPTFPTQPHTLPAVGPNAIPWPKIEKDPELAQQMLEILARLEAIDKRLGQLEQCTVSAEEKKKLKKSLRKIAKQK